MSTEHCTSADSSPGPQRPIGFLGIGGMGLPMAMNLLKSGQQLLVWNRSAGKCAPLQALGAELAASPGAVFADADPIILMLANAPAMDAVLQRGTPVFAAQVRGHTLIHMGTTAPDDSLALARDIEAAGGRYIECPVSGSPQRARDGQLVGMLAASDATAVWAELGPLLAPMCKQVFCCGPVPSALLMKLAVNLYLITTVTGLCEAFHFAQALGLDMQQFQAILNAGPMASSVSTSKLHKLLQADEAHVVEASIADVLKNNQLIATQARQAGIASPLLDVCHALFDYSLELGLGARDMSAVLQAIKLRSA